MTQSALGETVVRELLVEALDRVAAAFDAMPEGAAPDPACSRLVEIDGELDEALASRRPRPADAVERWEAATMAELGQDGRLENG